MPKEVDDPPASVRPKFTVSSAHGNPDPDNGTKQYDPNAQINCSVKSPVREGMKFWKCVGWVGEGSLPSKPSHVSSVPSFVSSIQGPVPQWGEGDHVTFPIDKDSEIAWQWQPITMKDVFKESSVIQNQVVSLILLVSIFLTALLDFYVFKHPFVLAVFAGALGGLIHELVQSYGKFLLPRTDEKGTFCLGGLIGIVSGGVAGLFTYQGLLNTVPKVGPMLAVTALVAGLAAKGIADAPNPPKRT